MKLLKIIFEMFGVILASAISLYIVFDFIVYNKQPTNFLIYISLLLYMQMFIKHKQ